MPNPTQAVRWHQSKIEQLRTLIAAHPCFSSLSQNVLDELVSLAFEHCYPSNQVIVSEGAYVDAVYFIIEGMVEVAVKDEETATHAETIPQLVLKSGDTIGLSNTGFYSKEAVRTATLTAISPVVLMGWPLSVIANFMQSHPTALSEMQHATNLMLRVHFIKKSAPFSDLSPQQIVHIAEKVEELSINAGTVLFHQGDTGDQCYLIQSGRVAILISDYQHNIQRTAAILESSAIFGELALLSNMPRNATAKALTDTKLLVLHKTELTTLVESHSKAAEAMTLLALERVRPSRRPNVQYYHCGTKDGETITILKDTKLGRYYQLSPLGWLIWQKLDGTQTIEDIAFDFFKKNKTLSPETITNIIFDLIDSNFVIFPSMNFMSPPPPATLEVKNIERIKNFLRKIIFIRFIFKDLDPLFTSSYHRVMWRFFTPIGKTIIALISIVGLLCFALTAPLTVSAFTTLDHPIVFLGLLLAAYAVLTIVHELAHAYTVKAFNHEVRRAGIIFYWLGLFAFVDTSDMWLSNKKQRAIVNLVGPYADLCIAGILSSSATLFLHTTCATFLWCLALLLYVSVLTNVNPLRECDGYHAITHMLEHTKLRLHALQLLTQTKLSSWFNLTFLRAHYAEFIYWAICCIFLTLNIGLAFLLQHYLRYLFPGTLFNIATDHLLWLLPCIVIVHFLLRIWYAIKTELPT